MLSLSTLVVKLIISRLIAVNRRGHNKRSIFFLNVRSVFQNIGFEASTNVRSILYTRLWFRSSGTTRR